MLAHWQLTSADLAYTRLAFDWSLTWAWRIAWHKCQVFLKVLFNDCKQTLSRLLINFTGPFHDYSRLFTFPKCHSRPREFPDALHFHMTIRFRTHKGWKSTYNTARTWLVVIQGLDDYQWIGVIVSRLLKIGWIPTNGWPLSTYFWQQQTDSFWPALGWNINLLTT